MPAKILCHFVPQNDSEYSLTGFCLYRGSPGQMPRAFPFVSVHYASCFFLFFPRMASETVKNSMMKAMYAPRTNEQGSRYKNG